MQELRRLRDLKTTPADADESHHRFALVGLAKTFDQSTQETYFTRSGKWWRTRYQPQPPIATVQTFEGAKADTQPTSDDTTQASAPAATDASHTALTAVLEEAGRLDADTLLIYVDTKVLAEKHTTILPQALGVSGLTYDLSLGTGSPY